MEQRLREARLRLIAENDRRITKLQNELRCMSRDLEILKTQFKLLVSLESGERDGNSNKDIAESRLSR
jgi:hypothetical protein